MNAERWQRVREIFEEACELGDRDRAGFLARRCGGDAVLREEIESIFDAGDAAPDAFGTPVSEAFPDLIDSACSLVGRRVGAYRLDEVIASGGMGTVYLASRADEQFERQVAIKLISPRGTTAAITDDVRRRFRAERQLLARLEHPHIARLHDGGVTDDGLPYLVMEHVQGQPIDSYCDDRALTTNDRLELFMSVASAVRYAHQNLVVHRDLKPGNILVTPDGSPKLLDFGIAEVIGHHRDGNGDGDGSGRDVPRIMTPEYASPEQIRGEPITTACDVYSLGVVLYELMTGRTPHRITSRVPEEIERAVACAPARPSTAVLHGERGVRNAVDARARQRRLTGDLDEIVLKALRPDPTQRYATVDQLAADIRRHLEHRPVSARPDTLLYRTTRLVRRNRIGVAAALALLLSLVGGVIGTTWQARQASAARLRTEQEATKVATVNAFLADMLGSIDPATGRTPQATVRQILDTASLRLAGGSFADQPAIEADLRTILARSYLELGAFDAAEMHLERALERALELRTGQPGLEPGPLGDVYDGLGRLARARGEFDLAEEMYRRALGLRAEHFGPGSARYAETANNLGVLLKQRGGLDEAEALLRAAIQVRRDLDPRGRDLATSLTNLAAVVKTRGRLDDAETMYRAALEIFRETLGEGHFRVAVVMNNIGLVHLEREAPDEAAAIFRSALEIRQQVFGEDHLAVATGVKNLALALTQLEQFDEAEALYRHVLDLEDRLAAPDGRRANTLTNFADVLARIGRLDEAEALARESLEIRRGRDPDHPRLGVTMLVLGRIELERGRPAAAEPLLLDALARIERHTPRRTTKIEETRRELARCRLERERQADP